MPPSLSPLWLVKEKKYAIRHFGLSRSPRKKIGKQFARQWMLSILHIFMIASFILKESSFPSWSCRGLFRSKFTPNLGDVFNCSILINDMQFYKRWQICDKKWLKCKKCSWSYQRNRAPLSKRLSNTPVLRFQIRAILVIESFFTKTEDHDCRLWTWYFSQ